MQIFARTGVLFLGFGLMIERAWAITILWSWFLQPVVGVAVSLVTVAGVFVMISVVRMGFSKPLPDDQTPAVGTALLHLAAQALAIPIGLGFGWLVLHFL